MARRGFGSSAPELKSRPTKDAIDGWPDGAYFLLKREGCRRCSLVRSAESARCPFPLRLDAVERRCGAGTEKP